MKIIIYIIVVCILAFGYHYVFTTPTSPKNYKLSTWDKPSAYCVDGFYSWSKTRSGTCSGHGGVLFWHPSL